MEPLVSVIVPVYDAQCYLQQCVDSLLSQSESQIEIILVDDGSPDDSGILCDQYAKQDARIQVIHKQNGGLSDARNAGLTIARGTAICFVDSDDFLHPDAIANLLYGKNQTHADIVCMRSVIVDQQGKRLFSTGDNTMNISSEDTQTYIHRMCYKQASESVCDKLFSKAVLVNRSFEKGQLNEDFLFLSKLLFQSSTIACVDFAGYHYRQHAGSITKDLQTHQSLQDAIDNSYRLMKIAETQMPSVAQDFAYSVFFQAKVLFTVLHAEKLQKSSPIYLKYVNLIKKCWPYWHTVKLKMIDRCFILCMLFAPNVSKKIVGGLYSIKKYIIQ